MRTGASPISCSARATSSSSTGSRCGGRWSKGASSTAIPPATATGARSATGGAWSSRTRRESRWSWASRPERSGGREVRGVTGPTRCDGTARVVRACEKLATCRGAAAFGTWLYRLAVNLILSRRAWLGARRARFIADDMVLETVPARAAATDAGLDFESAMGKLPPGARAVFVLHDVEGYRHNEIAELLDVTTGTTKAQLHRARMMLRRHLEAGGGR